MLTYRKENLEKLEIKIVNEFLIETAKLYDGIKNKEVRKNYNYSFITDNPYLFDHQVFYYVREMEIDASFRKKMLDENENTKVIYCNDENIKYMIMIYKIMKEKGVFDNSTSLTSDYYFKQVIGECYLTIFKNLEDYNQENNILYIKNWKVIDFIEKDNNKKQLDEIIEIINNEEEKSFKIEIVQPKY